MSRARRWITAVLIALTLIGIGGCWDERDISDRSPALGFGFDYHRSSGWSVAMSEVRFVQGTPSSYTGTLFQGAGPDLRSAMEDLRSHVGREIYLGSVKIFVLGPGLMENGVRDAIRLLQWNEEIDRTAFLVTTTKDPALILSSSGPAGPNVVRLLKAFETHKDVRDGFAEEPLWDAIRSLSTPGTTFQVPIFDSSATGTTYTNGTAFVGPDGRLSARLDTEHSKYLRWLMNRSSREVLALPDGQQVRTSTVRTQVHFLGSSRRVLVDVAVTADGHLVHASLFTSEVRRHLAGEVAALAIQHLTEALHALQYAGADVPTWKEIASAAGYEDWSLPKSTIQVRVRTTVAPFTSSGF